MTGRRRTDIRSLADLHDDALRETDGAAAEAAERYMAWFDRQAAPETVPADRPSERRQRVASAVEAMPSPESTRSLPDGLRPFVTRLSLPVALAAVASLALWLVARPSPAPAPSPISSLPVRQPQATAMSNDPCRAAIHARGDSPLIDDFEDGNELVALGEGRNGYWVALSDTDPDGAEPVLAPSIRPDPVANNRYALHIAGVPHQAWGVSLQVEFGPSCYDVSAYSGVAFEARGPGRLHAGIRTVDAVPVARGGSCTEDCNRSHLASVTLESGWKTYVLWWRDLHQEGAGTPLDPQRASGLEFVVRPEDTPYDVWIDDVRFVHESTDRSAP